MKSQPHLTRKALYESLFDNMLDGVAYCQMIFDAQRHPIDFRYILVNKNFEEMMGLKEAEGKQVTELIPGIVTSNPELFEIYGRVAVSGKSEKLETYVESLARWFSVSVYRQKKGVFRGLISKYHREKAAREIFGKCQGSCPKCPRGLKY